MSKRSLIIIAAILSFVLISCCLCFLCLLVLTQRFQVSTGDSLWSKMVEETWCSTNSFAGDMITFAEFDAGKREAYETIFGSGVPVLESSTYEVLLVGHTMKWRDEDGKETTYTYSSASNTFTEVGGQRVLSTNCPELWSD